MALFPAIGEHHRRRRPTLVGYLYAAPYAGALAASLASGWIPHVRRQGLARRVAAASCWGVAIAAFGFAESLWLALVLLALAGAADTSAPSSARRSSSPRPRTRCAAGSRGSSSPRSRAARRSATPRPALVASLTSLRFSIVSGGILCVVGTVLIALAFAGARPLRLRARSSSEPRPRVLRPLGARGRARADRRDAARGRGRRPIVEVEAYDREDPASHALRRPHPRATPRCSARPAMPTSTAPTGSTGASTSSARARVPSAVLVRALEPTARPRRDGARRGLDDPRLLCARPGPAVPGARRHAASTTASRSTRPPFELLAANEPPSFSRARASGSRRPPTCPGATAVAGSRFLSRPSRPA